MQKRSHWHWRSSLLQVTQMNITLLHPSKVRLASRETAKETREDFSQPRNRQGAAKLRDHRAKGDHGRSALCASSSAAWMSHFRKCFHCHKPVPKQTHRENMPAVRLV